MEIEKSRNSVTIKAKTQIYGDAIKADREHQQSGNMAIWLGVGGTIYIDVQDPASAWAQPLVRIQLDDESVGKDLWHHVLMALLAS